MAGHELLLSEQEQLDLAVVLVDNDLFGIYTDRTITLKNMRRSPHYLDARVGLSSYETRSEIVQNMANLATTNASNKYPESDEEIGAKYVIGSPEAMTSYASGVADWLRLGLLQPRANLDKVTGNKTPILGRFRQGATGAAFDDVVTDGDTKTELYNTLTKAGIVVKDYYVLLDREEGGSPEVKAATGLDIVPALGVSSLVRLLRGDGRISQAQYDKVAEYLTQYGEPHAQEAMNSAL